MTEFKHTHTQRLYFLLGDLCTNLLTGAIAASVVWFATPIDWPIPLAMCAGMLLGMIAGMVTLPIFVIAFGTMEVMVPVMLTSMIAGMTAAMTTTFAITTWPQAITSGALCGLAVLAFIALINITLQKPTYE